jgi:hypothetical protein
MWEPRRLTTYGPPRPVTGISLLCTCIVTVLPSWGSSLMKGRVCSSQQTVCYCQTYIHIHAHYICIRFEGLTAVGIMPHSPLKVNRRFGGTCRLHLLGRRISQASNQSSAFCLLHAGSLFGIFFDIEDGTDIFLRNVGWLSTEYTALYSRR